MHLSIIYDIVLVEISEEVPGPASYVLIVNLTTLDSQLPEILWLFMTQGRGLESVSKFMAVFKIDVRLSVHERRTCPGQLVNKVA